MKPGAQYLPPQGIPRVVQVPEAASGTSDSCWKQHTSTLHGTCPLGVREPLVEPKDHGWKSKREREISANQRRGVIEEVIFELDHHRWTGFPEALKEGEEQAVGMSSFKTSTSLGKYLVGSGQCKCYGWADNGCLEIAGRPDNLAIVRGLLNTESEWLENKSEHGADV